MIDGANNKSTVNQPSAVPLFTPPPIQHTAVDNTYVFHPPVLKDNLKVEKMGNTKALASLSFADDTSHDTAPVQTLKHLGDKYNVPFKHGDDLNVYQKKVVRAVVIAKAKEHGIPQNVALGMAGLESELKMWEHISGPSPAINEGRNYKWVKHKKILSSTDWGVMQINDKAHKDAFPRAKQDLEYNVDYGMRYLAETRKATKGSLGYGFGDWDRTIGAYNLGHNPSGKNDHKIARRYILAVKGALI